jgi:hypothetical protein
MPSLTASVQVISPNPRNRSQGYPSISLRRKAVWYVTTYANADQTGRDVHLSSMAPTSVERAYHKIWGAVKGRKVIQHLGGPWAATEVSERPQLNSEAAPAGCG